MFNVIAIAQKELQSYFASPTTYFVIAVFWFISGLFFVEILIGKQGIIQQIILSEQAGIEIGAVDVATELLNSFLSILGSLALLIVPLLSMGLYTEERKLGTLELLATSPITNWIVAVGKLLAVVLLFILMIFPSLVYEAIAFQAAVPAIALAIPFMAHVGLILLATAVLAWGMFISSLTSSTIWAAILTFSLILLVWIFDLIANNLGEALKEIFTSFSILVSYNNLLQGIVNTSDLILFFSYIFLGIFLTAQSVHLLRNKKQ